MRLMPTRTCSHTTAVLSLFHLVLSLFQALRSRNAGPPTKQAPAVKRTAHNVVGFAQGSAGCTFGPILKPGCPAAP